MFQHLLPVPPGISYEWVNKSPMQWQIDVKGCYKTKFLVRLQIFREKLLQHFNSLNILNSLVREYQLISTRFDLEDNWRHIPARGFDRTRIISTRGFLEGKISTSWLEVPARAYKNPADHIHADHSLIRTQDLIILRSAENDGFGERRGPQEDAGGAEEGEREGGEAGEGGEGENEEGGAKSRWFENARSVTQDLNSIFWWSSVPVPAPERYVKERMRQEAQKKTPEGGALDSGDPGFDLTSVQVQNL